LSREDKRRAKHGLSWGGIGHVMGRGTEGKEKPWEVGGPIRGGAPCPEGVFEATMETLSHPIGLRMEGSGGDVGNVEE